ncbi:DNA repair protein RadA [Actinobacteria bacterium IMCC26207]|nr:DNA repair protein RadA [Actinobacteria bacterium IMCC26207]
MAKTRTVFRCMSCGAEAPKWSGKCAGCGDWNTLTEELDLPSSISSLSDPPVPPVPITAVRSQDGQPVPTGIPEVDRVLGGGLVPGSVTLVGGEPGVGKSTLVLQLMGARAAAGSTVLYITGEESADQVRLRADRLGALQDNLLLAAETSLPNVIHHINEVRPEICVVDSIQTLHDPAYTSAPGSVTQVRECAHRLVQTAKTTGTTVLLVGHVTKDGQLAGPRVLEHVVDTVLSFEGDRHHALRLLRAQKHRFGSTEELGLFAMVASGLEPVPDPSGLFIGDRRPGIPGSIVTPALEGHRPLLVEVQTLVASSQLPQPRRSCQGLDSGRLALLLAVLERRAGIRIQQLDVYANAVGGVKVVEPGADLAICLALASAVAGVPIPPSMVACGEVGLGGEIRQVGRIERRVAEAARLGFTTAVVPRSAPDTDAPIDLLRVPSLAAAIELLSLQKQ